MNDIARRLQEVADRRGQIEDNLYKLLYKWCEGTTAARIYMHLGGGYHVRPGDSELYWGSARKAGGPRVVDIKRVPTKNILIMTKAWPDRLAAYKSRIK